LEQERHVNAFFRNDVRYELDGMERQNRQVADSASPYYFPQQEEGVFYTEYGLEEPLFGPATSKPGPPGPLGMGKRRHFYRRNY